MVPASLSGKDFNHRTSGRVWIRTYEVVDMLPWSIPLLETNTLYNASRYWKSNEPRSRIFDHHNNLFLSMAFWTPRE